MGSTGTDAVSPVVGVMLMLVVTIIIAAVVSAFSGGLSSSQAKVPQATIQASYSQSGGMTIYHNGGDALGVGEFKILLTPAKNWANEMSSFTPSAAASASRPFLNSS